MCGYHLRGTPKCSSEMIATHQPPAPWAQGIRTAAGRHNRANRLGGNSLGRPAGQQLKSQEISGLWSNTPLSPSTASALVTPSAGPEVVRNRHLGYGLRWTEPPGRGFCTVQRKGGRAGVALGPRNTKQREPVLRQALLSGTTFLLSALGFSRAEEPGASRASPRAKV